MDKTKTAVIIGIVTIIMLSVVIYLNRDKFGSQTVLTSAPAPEE